MLTRPDAGTSTGLAGSDAPPRSPTSWLSEGLAEALRPRVEVGRGIRVVAAGIATNAPSLSARKIPIADGAVERGRGDYVLSAHLGADRLARGHVLPAAVRRWSRGGRSPTVLEPA